MPVKSLKNILIPVNLPADSENAIQSGVAMCKRHSAALHLLFIKTGKDPLPQNYRNAEITSLVYQADLTNLKEFRTLASQIETEHQISCYFHELPTLSMESLEQKIKYLSIDLMILVKPEETGYFSQLFSSYSIYKLVKALDCPVLSLPPYKPWLEFKKVLFPVRALDESLEKLDFALPILERNQSEVLLFAPLEGKNETQQLSFVNILLNRANYKLQMHNLEVEREMVIADDLAKEVIQKAEELNSDLIIITATIAKGFSAYFTENYTQRVLKYSPVPVLSIKAAN
ncbi:MAG TPA: universal stress protein [Sphingobacteriaceae bacterium]